MRHESHIVSDERPAPFVTNAVAGNGPFRALLSCRPEEQRPSRRARQAAASAGRCGSLRVHTGPRTSPACSTASLKEKQRSPLT